MRQQQSSASGTEIHWNAVNNEKITLIRPPAASAPADHERRKGQKKPVTDFRRKSVNRSDTKNRPAYRKAGSDLVSQSAA